MRVPGVTIKGEDDRRIAHRIQTVVHPGYRIGILDSQLVQASAVHAEPELSTQLRDNHHWAGPFGIRGLDHAHLQQVLRLILGFLATVGCSLMRCRENWLCVRMQLDPVVRRLEFPQLARPHLSEISQESLHRASVLRGYLLPVSSGSSAGVGSSGGGWCRKSSGLSASARRGFSRSSGVANSCCTVRRTSGVNE